MSEELHAPAVYLERIARELATIRQLVSKAVNDMVQAESEIPERMRRFVNYMHDMHHIVWVYEERGIPAPRHVMEEMERCDDRMRQLLLELHTDGGAFEKIRREMASDPLNRWDHTRQLCGPKGEENASRQSNTKRNGFDEGRAEESSG